VAASATAADPRFREGVHLFNDARWYPCHDAFESLWFETSGPDRSVLQGFLQIAVAHLHLERGNRRGATMLMGEGLGRLRGAGEAALGIDLRLLRDVTSQRLQALQSGADPGTLPLPRLESSVDCPG
jgi:predicted metal-dependent hydrolase